MLEFKIGRKVYIGYEKDYLLDNGACIQLCTHDGRGLHYKNYISYKSVRLTKVLINSIDFSSFTKIKKDFLTYYIINKNSQFKISKKMKLQDLRKVAKECIEILGFEEIDPKGKEDKLIKELTEVALLIGADGEDAVEESELVDLTKTTKNFLLELRDSNTPDEEAAEVEEKPAKKEKKAKKEKASKKEEEIDEEEDEEEQERDMVSEVNEADLDTLKALIKENKESFPIASRGLPLQKNLDKLRVKALKDLGEEVEEEEKEEKPVKEKAPKKESKASAQNFIQTCICKNFKITTPQIIEKLNKAGYTTTSEKYVAMRAKECIMIINILKDLGKLN